MRQKILVFATLLILTAHFSLAADLSAFVRETQAIYNDNGKVTLTWWTPKSYWVAVLKENKNLTEEARNSLAATFEKYTVIAVCRGDVSALGSIQKSNEAVSSETITCFVNSKRLKRLAPEDIDAETTQLFAMMKPGMESVLGQFGKTLEFYIFENPYLSSGPLIENMEGYLTINAYEKKNKIRLPLAAMLDPKEDRKTGDIFPGNYKFNPYTGDPI